VEPNDKFLNYELREAYNVFIHSSFYFFSFNSITKTFIVSDYAEHYAGFMDKR
jgi:hypothetical protein